MGPNGKNEKDGSYEAAAAMLLRVPHSPILPVLHARAISSRFSKSS